MFSMMIINLVITP